MPYVCNFLSLLLSLNLMIIASIADIENMLSISETEKKIIALEALLSFLHF